MSIETRPTSRSRSDELHRSGASPTSRRAAVLSRLRGCREGHELVATSPTSRRAAVLSRLLVILPAAATLVAAGCGGGGAGEAGGLSGTVRVDGSSTVFPITEAVAEEFQIANPSVRVTVGISGTGGGFDRFCRQETDISDASRPIRQTEIDACAAVGVQFIEVPVSFDGLSVVVNPANEFVDYLTVDELRRIWEPNSSVTDWSDVRPEWPARPIHLYGPGTDSGTFDYFTEAILGETGRIRADFTASEDDNVLVQGVAGDQDALGFFGYAYYEENRDRIRVVPIADGDGEPVAPSPETINDGTYRPLSRPLFIYVSTIAAERPDVGAFVDFYLEHGGDLAREVGYVALPGEITDLTRQRWEERVTGSVFEGTPQVGVTLERLLQTQRGPDDR